jgi:hypothetical protein
MLLYHNVPTSVVGSRCEFVIRGRVVEPASHRRSMNYESSRSVRTLLHCTLATVQGFPQHADAKGETEAARGMVTGRELQDTSICLPSRSTDSNEARVLGPPYRLSRSLSSNLG